MPNQIYSLNPSDIVIMNSFAENVEKLNSIGIPASNIIDFYIEAQKYAKSICSLTNPMRYIEAREGQSELSDIRFRELERTYKEVVQSWSKLKPFSFIQQYEAYVAKHPNNTGIENGIVSQIFFWFTTVGNNMLVVNPSPSFIKQQKESSMCLDVALKPFLQS